MVLYLCFTLSLLVFLQVTSSAVAIDSQYGQAARTCGSIPKVNVTFANALAARPNKWYPVAVRCNEQLIVEPGQDYEAFGGIFVNGDLVVLDGGPDVSTSITTAYIIVQGSFTAGTTDHPYTGRLRITLIDYPVDIKLDTRDAGQAVFGEKINFGRRVFGAYGGHISLVGAMPVTHPFTYGRLAMTATKGATQFYVQGDLTSQWKVGDELGIAPGNIMSNADSHVTIKSISYNTQYLSTQITTHEPLQYHHDSRIVTVTRPSGLRHHFLSPEVAHLTRRIVIAGELPPGQDAVTWFNAKRVDQPGGHFMIAHAAGPQVVVGVQFVAMGQPGTLGRYPLHIHFGGNAHLLSQFKHNVIMYSKQRCVVIHATNNFKVMSNVAFRTAGHCYMTEDGAEVGNLFLGNLAIGVRKAHALIPKTDPLDPDATDFRPTGFWLAGPNNNLYHNAVGGSEGGGYWYEPMERVRGSSRKFGIPNSSSNPFRTKIGDFVQNVVHSAFEGLMTYPGGVMVPGETPAAIKNFFAWSVFRGWLSLAGKHQRMEDSALIDVYWRGVHTRHVNGYWLKNVDILGRQQNGGLLSQPTWCRSDNEGIHFENHIEYYLWKEGVLGIRLDGVHLQDFNSDTSCAPADLHSGIRLIVDKPDQWFPPSSFFKDVTYLRVKRSVFIDIKTTTHKTIAFRAKNIDLPGLSPTEDGFVVSVQPNSDSALTAVGTGCEGRTELDSRLRFCLDQCWRHVAFAYKEIAGQLTPTTVEFTVRATGKKFVETPDTYLRNAHGINVDRTVFTALPSGEYDVKILDRIGQTVPTSLYPRDKVRFYLPDTHDHGVPACDAVVSLFLPIEAEALKSPV